MESLDMDGVFYVLGVLSKLSNLGPISNDWLRVARDLRVVVA